MYLEYVEMDLFAVGLNIKVKVHEGCNISFPRVILHRFVGFMDDNLNSSFIWYLELLR